MNWFPPSWACHYFPEKKTLQEKWHYLNPSCPFLLPSPKGREDLFVIHMGSASKCESYLQGSPGCPDKTMRPIQVKMPFHFWMSLPVRRKQSDRRTQTKTQRQTQREKQTLTPSDTDKHTHTHTQTHTLTHTHTPREGREGVYETELNGRRT